jgi:hypothetical protein
MPEKKRHTHQVTMLPSVGAPDPLVVLPLVLELMEKRPTDEPQRSHVPAQQQGPQ